MSFSIDSFNAGWLDAWSRKDVDRLVSFYTPDTVYKDPQTACRPAMATTRCGPI